MTGLAVLFGVLLLLLVVLGLWPDANEIPPGVVGRHIDVLGAKMRVHQVGEGPDVFFIHGLPGTIEDWSPMVELLKDQFRLTMIDRPGHGYSSARGHAYTLEHNARVALAAIEALGLENVTVVGHSYGGAAAMAMAVQNPERVKSYVSVGGVVAENPTRPPLGMFRVVGIPILGRGIAALFSKVLGSKMLEVGVQTAFEPNIDAMPPGFLEHARKVWLTTKVSTTLARERTDMVESIPRLKAQYPNVTKHVVLVHGTADGLVPSVLSSTAHDAIRGSELVLMSDVGHYVQFARSEQLARIIAHTSTGTFATYD